MIRTSNEIITDTKKIAQALNDHYIYIVERSCGEKPASVARESSLTVDIKIVDHIIRHFEDDPSVRHIKRKIKTPSKFYLFFVSNIWARSQKDT